MRTLRTRGRGLAALVAILVLGFCATGFGPPGLTESSSADQPLYAYQVPQVQRLKPPSVGARAALAMDDATGQALYGKGERLRLPMASTTKVMTALLALERGRLSDVVRVSVNATDMPGSSVMGLSAGEQLTLEDLLYGLLLPSGNDAAVAIARHVAGSESAFVELMNRRAAELGLTDTHYANPHGLDAPDHYTSAADLARLTRVALRNPDFARIVATPQKTVRGRATYDLRNTNPLLGRPDVVGVKTGHTDLAGACLVGAFQRDGHLVITVVLNSPDLAADSVALADYAYSAYAWPTLALPADPLGPATGAQGPALGPLPPVVLPAWQVPYLRVEVFADAGEARFAVAGSPLVSVPLARPTPAATTR